MYADSPISWVMRHRLGQMVLERDAGLYRPLHADEPIKVTGRLDLAALDRAWRRVQQRHPVVLCGFDLSRAPDFVWRLEDPAEPGGLVVLPVSEEETASVAVSDAISAPFDRYAGPIARLVVAPLTGGAHVLALVVDHIMADFWSLNVLMHDLTAFYSEESGIPAPPRPPATLTFPEYARRQNAYLESPEGTGAIEAIGVRLADTGPIPTTRIAGFTGAATAGYGNTGQFSDRIDAELTAAVKQAARRARVSMWTFIHAASHRALADLSDDPAAASVMQSANRERPDIDQTVGWIAGKLVVPSRPHDAPDTIGFLRSFGASMLDTLDTADVPWPRLIAEYVPESFGRHSQRPYFGFNAMPLGLLRRLGAWRFPGCESAPFEASASTPDTAVSLSFTESEADIAVTAQYRADWYPAEAARNLWETVRQRLRSWVKESGVH